eukprot:146244_1
MRLVRPSNTFIFVMLRVWFRHIEADTKIDVSLRYNSTIRIRSCNGNARHFISANESAEWVDISTGQEPDIFCSNNTDRHGVTSDKIDDIVNGYMRATYSKQIDKFAFENSLNSIIRNFYAKSSVHIYAEGSISTCTTKIKLCVSYYTDRLTYLFRNNWIIYAQNQRSYWAYKNTDIEFNCLSGPAKDAIKI